MVASSVGSVVMIEGKEFVSTLAKQEGFALFGPYEPFGVGEYSVAFNMAIAPGDGLRLENSSICCRIDVAASEGTRILAHRLVPIAALKSTPTRFTLDFTVERQSTNLEFRAFVTGTVLLIIETCRPVVKKRLPGSYFPILRVDTDPHDALFARHYPLFKDLYDKGAKVTPTADGTLISLFGIKFVIRNVEDFQIVYEIFFRRVYNFYSRKDVCVVDIGMNVGLASLHFAQMPHVKVVHSFEPFLLPFNRALENFRLNPEISEKIRTYNFGLSDVTENLSVRYNQEQTISVSVKGVSVGQETHIVLQNAAKVMTDVIAEAEANGLDMVVKMDCEGSEFPIFEALNSNGLLRRVRIFMVEWHKWWSTSKTQHDIIVPLSRAGFNVFDHTNPSNPDAGELFAIRSY